MIDGIRKPVAYRRPQPRRRIELPRRRRLRPRFKMALVMLVLLAVGIFVGSRLVIFAQRIFENVGSGFSFGDFFIADDKALIGEEDGVIRVLLMGIGGKNHQGGTLTDTMILATLRLAQNKNEENQVGLVSIPRDFLVDIRGYDYRKINSAYAFGELGGQEKGPELAVETVENVLDIDIPYYAVLDFQGFAQVIDDLGGVKIDVPAGFTDAQYPDNQDGYLPPITFEAGFQKMNGERALQYVRSRHGNNSQGSDFARSQRQQLVLKSLKDEVVSLRVITNLGLINKLLTGLADHLRTNLEPHELKRLYDMGKDLDQKNIHSLAIDNQSGLVCNEIVEETGAYVVLPCAGFSDYSLIREFVINQFTVAPLRTENAAIEIQNASGAEQLATQVKNRLGLYYLKVTTANFRGSTIYVQSVIYDNTGGAKPNTLEFLQNSLEATVAASPFPFPTTEINPDFVIIVAP